MVPGSALPDPQAYHLLAEADRLWAGARRGGALHRGRIETPAWLQPPADAQINGIERDPDTQALRFAASNGPFRERAGVLQRLQPEQGRPPAIRYLLRPRASEWLAGGLGGLFAVFRPMPHRLPSTIGERLRSESANHLFVRPDARTLCLTASIGMREYPLFRDGEHRLGWQEMVELADRALYRVKRHGRNGRAALRPTASTRAATLLAQVREDLDMLLQSGQLRLLSTGTDAQGEPP